MSLIVVLVMLGVGVGVTPTWAQKKGKAKAATPSLTDDGSAKKGKKRVYDFGALSFEGSLRTPQLLYFLTRVKQELDRASLEKRSFMPELVRSVDEGGL